MKEKLLKDPEAKAVYDRVKEEIRDFHAASDHVPGPTMDFGPRTHYDAQYLECGNCDWFYQFIGPEFGAKAIARFYDHVFTEHPVRTSYAYLGFVEDGSVPNLTVVADDDI